MKNAAEPQEIKPKGPVIWAAIFVALILSLSIANLELLAEPVKRFHSGETDFAAAAEEIQTAYTTKFFGKTCFIDINGLYYRAAGRRVLNGVLKLENGMLTDASMPEQDTGTLADNIAAFSNYLAEEGTPFLYAQAPFKIDDDGLLLPAGRDAYVNLGADHLLDKLRKAGVSILDLRPYISASPELLEQNFFKTDHHWNYKGAFAGFQKITEAMQAMLDAPLDLAYADMEQWDGHILEDWFLGSRGKRVGSFFAGVDDVVYYTPKFDTYMSCAVPKHGQLYKGDFSAANIRNEYLERVDYFADNPYCLYVGGDYPLVQHRNYDAPNELKVLMIKDSFAIPVQAYMSALFQEIDVIDPRHFTAEYVESTRPDVVIMLINPSSFANKAYASFGVDGGKDAGKDRAEHLILEEQKVELAPKDHNYNYAVLASGLQYGKTYTLSFADVVFTQGRSEGVTASLYDPVSKTILASRILDIEFCRKEGGFEWTFNTPPSGNNDLQVLLYSGIWRGTAGIGTVYRDVSLSVLE